MRVDVWMAQTELDERRDLLGCRHRANERSQRHAIMDPVHWCLRPSRRQRDVNLCRFPNKAPVKGRFGRPGLLFLI